MFSQKKQAGLTLIEMMIAMVLGLFVTAVIITVFSTNVRSSTENIKMIRLNQELRGVMTLMVDEIKKHGYSSSPSNSGFMDKLSYDSGNNCINYAYDYNDDGIVNVNSDVFGIHHTNNTVYFHTNASSDCSTYTTSYPLSDPNLAKITALDFDFSGSVNTDGTTTGLNTITATSGVSIYEVAITITGSTDLPHSSDANDPRRTIVETVRIRNDAAKD
jgi:prepilin-type N-terminal cleavage/methylation domain-containing protein